MSNEPTTYHVLVTLPNTTGEESDEMVEQLSQLIHTSDYFDGDDIPRDITVQHLTPETLPDRYVERAKLLDLVHRLDRVIEDYVGQGDTEDVVAPLRDISTDLLQEARR